MVAVDQVGSRGPRNNVGEISRMERRERSELGRSPGVKEGEVKWVAGLIEMAGGEVQPSTFQPSLFAAPAAHHQAPT